MPTQAKPDSSPGNTEGEVVLEQPPVTPDAEQQTDSSTVETPAQPASLLDVVRSVVEPKPGETSQVSKETQSDAPEGADQSKQSPSPDGDAETKGEKDPAKAGEQSKDADLPFHKHPRFQELIQERNALRVEADQFRAISSYMAENGLSEEEVDQGFAIMAAIKNDPVRALQLLAPTIVSLQRAAGEILPDDLSELVETGEVSEKVAQDLARTRAQLAAQEARRQQESQRFHQHSAAQAEAQIVSAVSNWESQVAARDPDWQSKKAIVIDKIRLANVANPATTPQEALAIAEEAYRQATEFVKGFAPKRPPVKAPMASQSQTQAKPQIRSLADAVRRAVA